MGPYFFSIGVAQIVHFEKSSVLIQEKEKVNSCCKEIRSLIYNG